MTGAFHMPRYFFVTVLIQSGVGASVLLATRGSKTVAAPKRIEITVSNLTGIDHDRLARPERFELPTPWFVARYSIQLSYGRAAEASGARASREAAYLKRRSRGRPPARATATDLTACTYRRRA